MWTGILQEFEKHGGAESAVTLFDIISGVPVLGKVYRGVFPAKVRKETKASQQAIEASVAIAFMCDRFPVLFVDELNLAFSSEGDNTNHKAVLALLTRLTKQERELNVLPGSSGHAYPLRLKQELLVSRLKVPPGRMRELLTKHWGLGERLAECCLAAYGGHVYHTSLAISNLSLRKEKFKSKHATTAMLYSEIVSCVKAEEQHSGTIELLRQVAVYGWASLEDVDDPRAKLLSLKNVGGVVDSRSLVVGLPDEVWEGGANYGLVAESQQVRLMIGEVLQSRRVKMSIGEVLQSRRVRRF
jgi:hypothetical protein